MFGRGIDNFGDFLMMAPSSQTKEPPQKPGQFNVLHGNGDANRELILAVLVFHVPH